MRIEFPGQFEREEATSRRLLLFGLLPLALALGQPASEIQAPMALVIITALINIDRIEYGGRSRALGPVGVGLIFL